MSENEVRMEEYKEPMLYMCGYLPGASLEKSPILSPVLVRLPETVRGGDSWKDVCGGGCGFAMALSGHSFSLFPAMYLILYSCI